MSPCQAGRLARIDDEFASRIVFGCHGIDKWGATSPVGLQKIVEARTWETQLQPGRGILVA